MTVLLLFTFLELGNFSWAQKTAPNCPPYSTTAASAKNQNVNKALKCEPEKKVKVSDQAKDKIAAVERARDDYAKLMAEVGDLETKNSNDPKINELSRRAMQLSTEKLKAEIALFNALNPALVPELQKNVVKWPTESIRLRLTKFPELTQTIDQLRSSGRDRDADVLEAGDFKNDKFVALAQEQGLYKKMKLEVFVKDISGRYLKFKEMSSVSGSGTFGPKISEGDRQMPEGLFSLSNPSAQSTRFTSTQIGYGYDTNGNQNTFTNPSFGGDVKIHGFGDNITAGCLALPNSMATDIAALVKNNKFDSSLLVLPTESKNIKNLTKKQKQPPNSEPWNNGLARQAENLKKQRKMAGKNDPPLGGGSPGAPEKCSDKDAQIMGNDPNPATNLDEHYDKLICADAPFESVTCDINKEILGGTRAANDCYEPDAIPVPENLDCLEPSPDPNLPGGRGPKVKRTGERGRGAGAAAGPAFGTPGAGRATQGPPPTGAAPRGGGGTGGGRLAPSGGGGGGGSGSSAGRSYGAGGSSGVSRGVCGYYVSAYPTGYGITKVEKYTQNYSVDKTFGVKTPEEAVAQARSILRGRGIPDDMFNTLGYQFIPSKDTDCIP